MRFVDFNRLYFGADYFLKLNPLLRVVTVVHEIKRRKIHIPLSDRVIRSRTARFGDFSKLNKPINKSKSETTHRRFLENPKEGSIIIHSTGTREKIGRLFRIKN